MHRLYLYYCYQLGILPKKQQPRINRPELERIWKDTEKILAEMCIRDSVGAALILVRAPPRLK